jgi:hypothetical protein
MEGTPTDPTAAVPSAASELRSLEQRRRGLLAEMGFVVASGAVLLRGAAAIESAPLDLQFLFLAATGLFSLATIHAVDEFVAMLHAECPRCSDRFFGAVPRSIPSPLRRRCSHCGVALSGSRPRA